VPIAVTDDELGLAPAARIAACALSSALRICCTWGPNCECAADWNSVKLVWMLSIAVCTPLRPLLTLSDPSAPTEAFSLLAASQSAGVPLLAPPLAAPPALVAAVLAPGAGVGVGFGVDVPLLEQPATSAAATASAAIRAGADAAPAAARLRLGRATARACSPLLTGYSYRRPDPRWRGMAKRPVPVPDAQ
jgi:hypothetical protein